MRTVPLWGFPEKMLPVELLLEGETPLAVRAGLRALGHLDLLSPKGSYSLFCELAPPSGIQTLGLLMLILPPLEET